MDYLPYYQKLISKITGRSDSMELSKIEDVMRNDIFHSTLDWQSDEEFERGTKLAVSVLVECGEIGCS